MKITSWMKRHGLCPCCWLANKIKQAKEERCILCIALALVFSGVDLNTACADNGKIGDPCDTNVGQREAVQYVIALPSTRLAKLLGIPCPQQAAIGIMNASAENQAQRLAGNPYAGTQATNVYKLW